MMAQERWYAHLLKTIQSAGHGECLNFAEAQFSLKFNLWLLRENPLDEEIARLKPYEETNETTDTISRVKKAVH